MPDLIGVDGRRAAGLLRSRGFRVTMGGDQPYPGVAARYRRASTPTAGFQIAPVDPISIEVSR